MGDDRTDLKWWQWLVLAFLAFAGFGFVLALWLSHWIKVLRKRLAANLFRLGGIVSPEKEQDRYPPEVWAELQHHRKQSLEHETRVKKLVGMIAAADRNLHRKS